MALVNCRECGQTVSTEAKKCPHCGAAPTKTRRTEEIVGKIGCAMTLFFTIPFLILLAIMAGC